MYNKQTFFILILFTLIFTLPGIAQKKSITITTYYPAPYGVYREIRSQKMAIGDNYSDPSQHCWLGGSCPFPDIDEDADLVVEGNVGIGETEPEYKLDIAGALRLQPGSAPTGANGVIYYDSSEDKFKCYQAGSWVDCMGSGTGYWAASGNHIYNTNTGNVGIGITNPRAKLHVKGAILAQGDPQGASFKVGFFSHPELSWHSDSNCSVAIGYDAGAGGRCSISIGDDTFSRGTASIAMGESTNARGDYSITMGYGTDASGTSSIAMGFWAEADEDYSVAIGYCTGADSNYSIVIGQGAGWVCPSLTNNIASSLMVGFNSDIPTLFVGPSSGKGTTGKVGIGTTTPKNKLDVEGGVAVGTSYAGTHTAPSNGMIIQGKVGIGTTNPGSYKLYVNGSLRCTSCTGCSTKEMKKDIRYLSKSDYKEILKKLEKIKVVTYRWKEEANADDKLHIGVISEEAPDEIVTKDKKAIDISDYLGFLLAIIKAQQDEIKTLKKQLKLDDKFQQKYGKDYGKDTSQKLHSWHRNSIYEDKNSHSTIFAHPGLIQEEIVTITTYYPLPFGAYKELRAKKMAIGDNYYSPSDYSWGVDIDSDADLVVEGNVGIGETGPGYKLDIAGALRLQPGSAPTGANGVIYYDSSEDKFKCYQAGSWADCIGAISTGYWAASGNHIYNTNTGNVGIGTTNPRAKLHVNGSILAQGSFSSGQSFSIGSGTWLLWYPRRAAFRAGRVTALQWHDGFGWVGHYSIAMGYDTIASRNVSIAMGYNTTSSGDIGIAMGYNTTASWVFTTAMGYNATASDRAAIAIGAHTTASGEESVAIGTYTTASGENSIVIGQGVDNTDRLVNNIASSLMVGFNSDIPTLFVGPSSGKGTTGKVGIGTTTPKNKLDVEGGVAVGTSYAGTHTAPSNGMIIQGKVGIGTTNPGSYKLYVNGSLRCTSCTGCSTKEMKKDIRYLSKSDYKEILKKLEKIKVVTYRWKEEANADDKLHIGVISEEAPDEIVTKDKKAIDISDYLGFLLAIAKAQQDEIEALKTHLKSDNRL